MQLVYRNLHVTLQPNLKQFNYASDSKFHFKGPFTNDVSREGEGGGLPKF